MFLPFSCTPEQLAYLPSTANVTDPCSRIFSRLKFGHYQLRRREEDLFVSYGDDMLFSFSFCQHTHAHMLYIDRVFFSFAGFFFEKNPRLKRKTPNLFIERTRLAHSLSSILGLWLAEPFSLLIPRTISSSQVQASMQHLMHHVTVSLQLSKITLGLRNNCINNTSIAQPTLSFYLWLKM